MITESEMYWITRLDYFRGSMLFVMSLALMLCVVFGLVGAILRNEYCDDKRITGKRLHKWSVTCGVLSVLVVCAMTFVPSTKDYAAIKIIPAIANNETLKQDGQELYKLAVGWAKEKLGETKGGAQ